MVNDLRSVCSSRQISVKFCQHVSIGPLRKNVQNVNYSRPFPLYNKYLLTSCKVQHSCVTKYKIQTKNRHTLRVLKRVDYIMITFVPMTQSKTPFKITRVHVIVPLVLSTINSNKYSVRACNN